MPKIVDEERRAVGAYIFAGGFTLGVRKHFDVVAHLENGKFGTETARKNLGVPIYQSPKEWPLGKLRGIDLVYCNPPCSPWSTAGIVRGQSTAEQVDWKSHKLAGCVASCFSLLGRLRPRVWVFESVRQVYSRGGEMLDKIAEEAMRLGYAVTDLFVEAKDFGVPQHRKRYFFVAHRVEVGWRPPPVRDLPTVDEALAGASEVDDMVGKMPGSVEAVCRLMGRGENARMAWDRGHEVGDTEGLGTRPAFIYDRMAADRPSYTVLGSCNKVHPREDRMLSVNESASLCGYPPDFRFIGSIADRYAQVGKGVCPPVAEWLAGELRRAIDDNTRVEIRRTAVDVTMGQIRER